MVNLGINGLRDITSIGQVFTYYRSPTLASISPSIGYLEGHEAVKVSGTGFRNGEGLGCKFGGVMSKAAWISDTVIICTSPPAADKYFTNKGVPVQVTNNGVDYTSDIGGPPEYFFIYRPSASAVEPDQVMWETSTTIKIEGKHLMHVTSCQFGDINETYPAFNVTEDCVMCKVPPIGNAPLSFLPLLSRPRIPLFLGMENGMVMTGIDIKYKKPPRNVPNMIKQPQLTSILPSHGSANDGETWVRVHGKDFLNTDELACKFGDVVVHEAHFISTSEIRCRTPRHLPGKVSFGALNYGSVNSIAGNNQSSGFEFEFVSDLSITTVFPSSGSIKGGTGVQVFGSFPSPNDTDLNVTCKFGMSGAVTGELVSQNQISCSTPPLSLPETVEVRVSCDGGQNFAKSSSWFSYVHDMKIESLVPNYRYLSGGSRGSLVTVLGHNFRDATGLKCIFGEVAVSATFHSSSRVSCVSPTEMKDKVAVRLATEADIGSTSWKYFEYIAPPQVYSISPVFGDSGVKGGREVTVRGFGFRNTMQMACTFGMVDAHAIFIDSTTILCDIPQHPPGVVDFSIVDRYAVSAFAPAENSSTKFYFVPRASIYDVGDAWNVADAGSIILARGTNFDTTEDIACRFGSFQGAYSTTIAMTKSLLSCSLPSFIEKNDYVNVAIGLRTSDSVENAVAPQVSDGC